MTEINRRTVTKGIAWSVPVVAVAGAAPAFAASGAAPTIVFNGACKSPGGRCSTFKHGYAFTYTVTNNDDQTIYITSAEATCTSGDCPPNLTWHKVEGETYAIDPGETVDLVFVFLSSNSANREFSGDVKFYWNHGAGDTHSDHVQPVIAPYEVVGTPPECPCYA